MVIPEGARVYVTSRSVAFDELRASEKAKHIDAAKILSRGYDVIVPEKEIIMEEVQTPTKVRVDWEAGTKTTDNQPNRQLQRSAKSTLPKSKQIAEPKLPRRSKRLEFSNLAEIGFIERSVGDMRVVMANDEQFSLLGEVEMGEVPKGIRQAFNSN